MTPSQLRLFPSRAVLPCLFWLLISSLGFGQSRGDVSGDGSVSLFDSIMIRDHLLERSALTSAALVRADANQDGRVNMADVVYVNNHFSSPVVMANVTNLDADPRTSVTALTTGSITLQMTGPTSPSIKVGDIIAGTYSDGYLRRVTAVSVQGQTIVAQTDQASLAQAIRSGQFSDVFQLSRTAGRFVPASQIRREDIGSLVWDLSGTVLFQDFDTAIIVESGSLTFTPTVALDACIEHNELKYFRAVVSGTATADMTVRFEFRSPVSASISPPKWPKIYQHPFLVMIGPVPVGGIIEIGVTPSLGIAMPACTVRANMHETFNVTVGAEYTQGAWRSLSSISAGASGSIDGPRATGSVSLSLHASAAVKFYGVAGPTFGVGPRAKLEATVGVNPPVGRYRLLAGVTAGLTMDVGILDWLALQWELAEWVLWEREIFSRSFVPQTGTVTIDVTPDAGFWGLAGPAGFTTVYGSGDRLSGSAITDAPIGDYYLGCSNVLATLWAPAEEGKTLVPGGTIAFTPTYTLEPPQTGMVVINVTPDAGSWTLTGPAGFTTINGAGDRLGGSAITDAPIGDYTLTCNDNVPGYNPPAPETKTPIYAGWGIYFTPTYTPENGTITIDVTPDSGSWGLAGPAGFTTLTGTGDRLAGSAISGPPGDYTLTCNDNVMSYNPPAPDTKTLAVGGTVAFTPTYTPESGPEEIAINLPGNVPLVLVGIPAGSFQMGSPDTERSRYSDEGPVHAVNIAYSFYMGKYELTQRQWLAVMGSWPDASLYPTSTFGLGDNYPAYYVSWSDAQNFITALNTHVANTGQGPATFRLPSEAEWEYSCRAQTQTRFFFGDSLSVDDGATDGPAGTLPGNRSDYMCFGANKSPYGSKPVGTKLPNQFGLYDMSGNVLEWCQDWYHPGYSGAPTNGSAWDVQDPGYLNRVIRGGYWFYYAFYCRSARRLTYYPDLRTSGLGFRFVRTQ
jgi:formylglycine-generating enzyme required for sulfatase activity